MKKLHFAAVAVIGLVLGLASPAFAQTAPDVDAEVTTYITGAVNQLVPVVLAVATGTVILLVLRKGIGMARKAIARG